MSALKGRHGLESELNEVRVQLEQALVAKSAAEDRALILLKEKNSGMALIEEKDEQYQQLMRKYKAAIQQTHLDHIAIADHIEQSIVIKLRDEVDSLQEQITEAGSSRDKENEALRKARKENQQLQETIEELQKRDLDSAHKKKSSHEHPIMKCSHWTEHIPTCW
ncbi:hypothetical protein TELCIR_08307 [Teladorsagia circumcincta]|uniref:Uncharacterized protein n=1 Tax=Teladorsagia circumcincta TaxID=45464 RepID=A0A2G9UJE4_TELCI|nr:hypothetical protein TELCIR_08307 [Teladorsagia circumcincta]